MRSLSCLLAIGLVMATAMPAALAESASDKAAAREVATEGIELYRAGKYPEALDRLRRAQALYDAPVHLIYIARCQDKLGQLVEASENYRLLDHYALPSGAPPAWVSAVEDGRKELAALEPRIPRLRILTEPGVRDPALRVDGNPVSAAALGIQRPVNPGTHHIELAVSGFEPGVADVVTQESESKDVTVPVMGAPPPAQTAPAAPEEKPALVGFLVGLRLGGSVPTGQALHVTAPNGPLQNNGGRDINMSDIFQSGGGLELHAGVRIAQYFTPVLYVEGQTYTPGNGATGFTKPSGTSSTSLAIGIIVGTQPHKLGGFGEIDFARESYAFTATPTTDLLPTGGVQECKIKGNGGALRIGGGGFLPVLSFLNATAFAMVTIGRFGSLDINGCDLRSRDIASDDQRTHSAVFIGLGGDFVFGADRVKE
jgi:hypothetical protein